MPKTNDDMLVFRGSGAPPCFVLGRDLTFAHARAPPLQRAAYHHGAKRQHGAPTDLTRLPKKGGPGKEQFHTLELHVSDLRAEPIYQRPTRGPASCCASTPHATAESHGSHNLCTRPWQLRLLESVRYLSPELTIASIFRLVGARHHGSEHALTACRLDWC